LERTDKALNGFIMAFDEHRAQMEQRFEEANKKIEDEDAGLGRRLDRHRDGLSEGSQALAHLAQQGGEHEDRLAELDARVDSMSDQLCHCQGAPSSVVLPSRIEDLEYFPPPVVTATLVPIEDGADGAGKDSPIIRFRIYRC
jgi:hypothetical protein